MSTEGDRFRRLLPCSFLALTLPRVLVKAFYAAPCAGDVNSIQQVYGGTYSHKLSKHMVSTCTTVVQQGYDKLRLPGVQLNTGI